MGTPKGSVPWNAGTSKGWVDQRGYRWLYVLENGKRRARREHRVIVERHLGRRLEPWEVVHHKDGNAANNNLENLEVVEHGSHTAAHHSGSRRSNDTRRSLEAFALLREELKAERAIKSELLGALKSIETAYEAIKPYAELPPVVDGEHDVYRYWRIVRAAIAKATGEQP